MQDSTTPVDIIFFYIYRNKCRQMQDNIPRYDRLCILLLNECLSSFLCQQNVNVPTKYLGQSASYMRYFTNAEREFAEPVVVMIARL